MKSCSFERLIQLLDKKLDLNSRIEVFDHLDRCDNCRETIYQIVRDRDTGFFTSPQRKPTKTAVA